MPTVTASFVPILVPTPPDSSASSIASFNAQFVNNVTNSVNGLLTDILALKGADFFSVGSAPILSDQLLAIDQSYLNTLHTRPGTSLITFGDLQDRVSQLEALSSPTPPTLTIPSIDVPTLDAVAPTIVIPAPPSADVGPQPSAAPSVESPLLPDAPLVVLPTLPTFDELQLPVAPSMSLPSWTATPPQNLLTPPTSQFAYVDTGYASPLHDPLVAKLLNDLVNGSYGIDANDETALWFRARDRAAQQAKAAVEEAQRRMASTSFPMPQGTMIEAIDQAEQKAQQILSDANRDIGLRRSELYVQGRKFTIEQVKEYEQVRINLYNAQQERALNASKATVELAIAVYDAGLKNFQALLEGYKAEAQVFETRIRGELAKAEIYKAQIEAEKLRADFNRAKLDLYQGQINAINSTVELYKARLAAADAFMRVQGQKLEVFKTQVQAYAERVRAKEAEYGIYQAQIKGQLASLDVFKTQIEAYNARLSGLEARGRIALQGNEALVSQYRVAVAQYGAQLESFKKQIDARIEEARTRAVIYSEDTNAYRALIEGARAGATVQTEVNKYNLDWNKAVLASKVANVEFSLKQLGMSTDLMKNLDVAQADILKSALGAAASGLNSLGVNTASS